MPSAPDPTPPENPPSDATEANPYAAPRSGPDPVAPETGGIPNETKALMVVAMALSAGWPVYFGFVLTNPNGRLVVAATLALIAGVVWHLLHNDRDRFDALAKGLLTLGLISLFPILPMVIGGICVYVVGSVMRPAGPAPLDPVGAAAVTILVAGFYVIAGLGVGVCFRSFRQRKERRPMA